MTKRPEETPGNRSLRVALALVIASGAAACSDAATANATNANQLAFRLASQTSASATIVPVTQNGHTLDLTRVSLTVDRAKLKREHDNACADDVGEDDAGGDHHGDGSSGNSGPGRGLEDCATVRVGSTTVDLPLSGNVVTLPAGVLPAGTFHELEVRISQLHLVGTFDGQAFDVTLALNANTEIEFDTPLVVTDGSATSITVNVPVADWLVNADGSFIDPSKIASTPSLLAQVRNKIAASLRAFEDRDHDGHDDHGGHGPG